MNRRLTELTAGVRLAARKVDEARREPARTARLGALWWWHVSPGYWMPAGAVALAWATRPPRGRLALLGAAAAASISAEKTGEWLHAHLTQQREPSTCPWCCDDGGRGGDDGPEITPEPGDDGFGLVPDVVPAEWTRGGVR